jgi:hypothetical protein
MFRFTHHPANWGRSTNPVRPGPPLACRQVPVDPVEVVGREVDDGYVAEGEEDDVSADRRASGRVLGARPRALECSSYSTMSDRKVAVLPVGSAVVTSSRTRRGPADLPW